MRMEDYIIASDWITNQFCYKNNLKYFLESPAVSVTARDWPKLANNIVVGFPLRM
jgi:hypothetical protein